MFWLNVGQKYLDLFGRLASVSNVHQAHRRRLISSVEEDRQTLEIMSGGF
jgi:hypothetical protein